MPERRIQLEEDRLALGFALGPYRVVGSELLGPNWERINASGMRDRYTCMDIPNLQEETPKLPPFKPRLDLFNCKPAWPDWLLRKCSIRFSSVVMHIYTKI
jgi:hypothetical protein